MTTKRSTELINKIGLMLNLSEAERATVERSLNAREGEDEPGDQRDDVENRLPDMRAVGERHVGMQKFVGAMACNDRAAYMADLDRLSEMISAMRTLLGGQAEMSRGFKTTYLQETRLPKP
jgi:hypothetical protein